MNNSYVLGKNKTSFSLDEFPKIATGEKIGILFTGDIETTLIALIAKDLYGMDNVVFVLIAFEEFLQFKNDEDKLNFLKEYFDQAVKKLGGTHQYILTNTVKKNRNMTVEAKRLILQKYPQMKFMLSGHNKIHEQCMTMLKDSKWSEGKITNDKLESYLETNKNKYPELYNYVFKQQGKLFGVSKYIGFEQYEIDYETNTRPFKKLTQSEIIDLYNALGYTSQLYQTSSCDVSMGNCGICESCARRKAVFKDSTVADLTNYSFN